MTDARVEVSAEDRSMRISLSGEIDLANAAAVEDEIREAVSNLPAVVSVDLSDLTYLDSAGVRILFTLASRLQALRIALRALFGLDHAEDGVVDRLRVTYASMVKDAA